MKKSKFADSQIMAILNQGESGYRYARKMADANVQRANWLIALTK